MVIRLFAFMKLHHERRRRVGAGWSKIHVGNRVKRPEPTITVIGSILAARPITWMMRSSANAPYASARFDVGCLTHTHDDE